MAYAIFIFASCGTQSLFAKIPNTPIWNKIKTQCATYLPDCELSFQLLEDLRKNRITDQEAERKVSELWTIPVKIESYRGPRSGSWSFEGSTHFAYYLDWSLGENREEIEMSVSIFYRNPTQSVLSFKYDKKLSLKDANFSEFKKVGSRDIEKIVDASGEVNEILYFQDPTPIPLSKIYPEGFTHFDKTVLVGLVDSGVDYNHPSIAKQILRDQDASGNTIGIGKDFYDEDAFAFDLCAGEVRSHGTSVASIIASYSPQIMILPLRYTGNMDLREVVRYGHERGVRIFNFSLGFAEEGIKSENLKTTIRETATLYPDTLFVWAAGNELTDLDHYPQMKEDLVLPNVVYVASVNENLELDISDPGGSNYGLETVDFAHFGVNQKVATPGKLHAVVSGTSFAAPQVAGLAASLQLIDPKLKGAELADRLRKSVRSEVNLEGKLRYPGVPSLLGSRH